MHEKNNMKIYLLKFPVPRGEEGSGNVGVGGPFVGAGVGEPKSSGSPGPRGRGPRSPPTLKKIANLVYFY